MGAVAAGEVDLGWVGARAFAELGVTSFDALLAPMLLDGMGVQQAVLDSELPAAMLPGVEALGVTGLAVIGGDLRRPIGRDGPLLAASDFAGLTFHTAHSAGNVAAVAALGAVATEVAASERNAALEAGTIQGYENSLLFYKEARLPPGAHITINIAFWPSVGVLIANPDRLDTLTTAQLTALREAAASTAARSSEIARFDQAVLERICRDGGHLAVASQDDIASLHAAFQPVSERLAEDPATAAHVARIEQLKATVAADPELVPPAGCA